MTPPCDPLLSAQGLCVEFRNGVRAVADVDVSIGAGEIVGLVGESGSGKTTLVNTLLRMIRPHGGTVHFGGLDLKKASRPQLQSVRKQMQVVPQNPSSSLNPHLTITQSVAFNLRVHRVPPKERRRTSLEMLDRVGIPAALADRYPRELSGGQVQRVAIARALVTGPRLVICDEPVSALDKSVQAQILNLLADLRSDFGVALLFVSHDLEVVEHISDRVLVMYLGRIVEEGSTVDIINTPRHPYTQVLVDSIPRRGQQRVAEFDALEPSRPHHGCNFRDRCLWSLEACADYDHHPIELSATHHVRCARVFQTPSQLPSVPH